jgi:hypothetical protein
MGPQNIRRVLIALIVGLVFTALGRGYEYARMGIKYPQTLTRTSFTVHENSNATTVIMVNMDGQFFSVSAQDYTPLLRAMESEFSDCPDGDLDDDNQLIDAFGNTSIGVVIGQEGTIPASAVESLAIEEGDSSKRYTYDPDTTIRGRILIWSVESVTKSNNATVANFVTYPRMNTESTKQ